MLGSRLAYTLVISGMTAFSLVATAANNCLSQSRVLTGKFYTYQNKSDGLVDIIVDRTSPNLDHKSSEMLYCKRTHVMTVYSVAGGMEPTAYGFASEDLPNPQEFQVATGDFLGNGASQVIYHRNSPHQVRIYSFEKPGKAPQIINLDPGVTYGPEWNFLVGDFDGDGISDFMMHKQSPQEAVVYLTRVDSLKKNILSFVKSAPLSRDLSYPAGFELALGDFNGDGKTDYMLHRNSPHETSVYIARMTPNGITFDSRVLSSQDGLNYSPEFKLSVGDFNGDGKMDYMLHRNNPHETSVYRGRVDASGKFYFEARTLLSQDNVPYTSDFEMALADFNSDGKTDYMLYNNKSHETSTYLAEVKDGVLSFSSRVLSSNDKRNYAGYSLHAGAYTGSYQGGFLNSVRVPDGVVSYHLVKLLPATVPGKEIQTVFYKNEGGGIFAPGIERNSTYTNYYNVNPKDYGY